MSVCVGAHLVLFPHHGQRFDVMLGVFSLLQTLHTHGDPAAVAVHAEVFRFVIHAGRRFPRGGGWLLTAAAGHAASHCKKTKQKIKNPF